MVNNLVLRLIPTASCVIKQKPNGRLSITNGPIYCLRTAQSLITLGNLFVLNEKARQNKTADFMPELSDEELVEFVLALEPADHVESERCSTSINRTVDCDGYAMRWNRYTRKRWDNGASIYVKFGFVENITRFLVISIHPSKVK